MAEIVTLLQNVAQIVRRAPEPTLVHAYLRAARKFCLESRWLRRELTLTTISGDNLYDLVQSGLDDPLLEIVNIRVITITDTDGSRRRIDPSDPVTWNPSISPGAPQTWAYVPESQVALYPTPNGAFTLTITAQCQPLLGVEELPDDLLRKWDRALDDGALAYLLELPNQPWTSPALARQHAIAFQAAINNARADEQRGYNTGTVMARIRRLF
jgi:hypothetical protein